jgi:hypothetical protein
LDEALVAILVGASRDRESSATTDAIQKIVGAREDLHFQESEKALVEGNASLEAANGDLHVSNAVDVHSACI